MSCYARKFQVHNNNVVEVHATVANFLLWYLSTSRSNDKKEINSRMLRPWQSSSATKQLQKFFVADEDLHGQSVLLLTSLLWEVFKYHERHNNKLLDKIGYWKDSSVLFLTSETVCLPHSFGSWGIFTSLSYCNWIGISLLSVLWMYLCTYIHSTHLPRLYRGLLLRSLRVLIVHMHLLWAARWQEQVVSVCVWWVLTGCVLPLTCRSASAASSWWPLPRDGCPWS